MQAPRYGFRGLHRFRAACADFVISLVYYLRTSFPILQSKSPKNFSQRPRCVVGGGRTKFVINCDREPRGQRRKAQVYGRRIKRELGGTLRNDCVGPENITGHKARLEMFSRKLVLCLFKSGSCTFFRIVIKPKQSSRQQSLYCFFFAALFQFKPKLYT